MEPLDVTKIYEHSELPKCHTHRLVFDKVKALDLMVGDVIIDYNDSIHPLKTIHLVFDQDLIIIVLENSDWQYLEKDDFIYKGSWEEISEEDNLEKIKILEFKLTDARNSAVKANSLNQGFIDYIGKKQLIIADLSEKIFNLENE